MWGLGCSLSVVLYAFSRKRNRIEDLWYPPVRVRVYATGSRSKTFQGLRSIACFLLWPALDSSIGVSFRCWVWFVQGTLGRENGEGTQSGPRCSVMSRLSVWEWLGYDDLNVCDREPFFDFGRKGCKSPPVLVSGSCDRGGGCYRVQREYLKKEAQNLDPALRRLSFSGLALQIP